MSRSWNVPHDEHVHVRSESVKVSFFTSHAEQIFDDGNHRLATTTVDPAIPAL